MTDPLRTFLGSGDTLARLHDHARLLQRYQTQVAHALPGAMGEACSVANVKGDVLVLVARSGSVASRVRQMVPSLVGALAAAGVPVRDIEVKVAITVTPEPAPPREARILGDGGRESLGALIANLPKGDPLAESLQRLLDRSRSR